MNKRTANIILILTRVALFAGFFYIIAPKLTTFEAWLVLALVLGLMITAYIDGWLDL